VLFSPLCPASSSPFPLERSPLISSLPFHFDVYFVLIGSPLLQIRETYERMKAEHAQLQKSIAALEGIEEWRQEVAQLEQVRGGGGEGGWVGGWGDVHRLPRQRQRLTRTGLIWWFRFWWRWSPPNGSCLFNPSLCGVTPANR
jgi:hypothetical protein